MRRRDFLTSLTAVAAMGRGLSTPVPISAAQASAATLDRPSYSLLQTLVRPIRGSTLDLTLVNDEALLAAARHSNPDLRAASLFLLDELMAAAPSRVRKLLTGDTVDSSLMVERLSALTTAEFLTQTRLDEDPWVEALSKDFSDEFGDTTHKDIRLLTEARESGGRWLDMPRQSPVERQLIVLHGTFARGEDWWRFPSRFTQYLDHIFGGAVYKGSVPFVWSGGNSDAKRRSTAADLVKWVRANPAQELIVVAHSHGGNVAGLATRLGVKIDRLVLLGTPVRSDCPPDIRRVGTLYNVYSLMDLVQTPAGTFPHCRGDGRTFGDSERVVNTPVSGEPFGPSHSDLHEERVWTKNGLDSLITA